MSRHLFLGDLASWATDIGADETSINSQVGMRVLFIPSAQITFWSAATGGSQYTDLQDTIGSAVMSVTADANGEFPQVYGPDGVWFMWADGGAAARRLVVATDFGATIDSNVQSISDLTTQVTSQSALVASSLGVVEYDSASSSWPTRPSDSRIYVWVGPSAPPVGGGYMQDGRDFWLQPNPVA